MSSVKVPSQEDEDKISLFLVEPRSSINKAFPIRPQLPSVLYSPEYGTSDMTIVPFNDGNDEDKEMMAYRQWFMEIITLYNSKNLLLKYGTPPYKYGTIDAEVELSGIYESYLLDRVKNVLGRIHHSFVNKHKEKEAIKSMITFVDEVIIDNIISMLIVSSILFILKNENSDSQVAKMRKSMHRLVRAIFTKILVIADEYRDKRMLVEESQTFSGNAYVRYAGRELELDNGDSIDIDYLVKTKYLVYKSFDVVIQ
jgi:hypothetical protein